MEPLGVKLSGNIFQRPVLTEIMCGDERNVERIKLADAQIVPRALMWSSSKKINLDLERDIGPPPFLPRTKEIKTGHPAITTRKATSKTINQDVSREFYESVYRKLV